jgi:hypothetical protein
MTDGVNRKALSVELQTLDQAERQERSLQFREWLRAAARSRGGSRPLWLALACIALMSIIAGCAYVTRSRFVFAGAILLLAPTLLFCQTSNWRARQWRREHPFEEWSDDPPPRVDKRP